MNAHQKFLATAARVDAAAIQPLPSSRKIYAEGSRPDIRVPMREIAQGDTPASVRRGEEPADLRLRHIGSLHRPRGYDRRSRRARAAARAVDRGARGHRAARRPELGVRPGAARGPGARGDALRPEAQAAPREGGARRHADALRAPGHRHARDGVHRDPREPAPARVHRIVARKRPDRREARRSPRAAASWRVVRRLDPCADDPGVRARRGGARPGDHPGEHQPPGNRADGHRPQLPGEDQREHRQLRGHVLDRRGGREDDLVDPLGRRHGHGSLDRQAHPRDARVDHPQRPGPDRHRADLPGAREGGRESRGPDVGDLPRHADRAGRAGRRLLHHPRRRAAAVRPADREAPDRHRLARRLDRRQVVPRAPPGELPLHAFRGHLRDHARPTTSRSRSATACVPARSTTRTTRRSSRSCARSASSRRSRGGTTAR